MKLGEVIREWRYVMKINIRDASSDIGITQSTLSRIENGKPCDGATLASILRSTTARR